MYKETGSIEEEFKDILALLGRDIRGALVDNKINEEFPVDRHHDNEYVVREILSEVRSKVNNREIAKNFAPAFRKLLQWFVTHPRQAEDLFGELYLNKHVLYDDEEITSNIAKAEQLSNLFTEFNVSDIEQLRAKISAVPEATSILPVTQEILMGMGITNISEWKEALKDKNLAELFAHESTPTEDMFVYAQSLIEQAWTSLKAHLNTLDNYDISNAEKTAPTIFAGVLKNGQEISIVIRPAYNKQVIIYYGSELSVLENEPSELTIKWW